MTAKKASIRKKENQVAASRNAAQHAEYGRNYVKIRDAVRRVIKECWGEDDGRFSVPILAIVRERIAHRVTQVSDSDIDAALACVESTRPLVRRFKRHCAYKDYWRERNEREQQSSNGHSDWYKNVMRELCGIVGFPRDRPTLRLVPGCGRDLAPDKPRSVPGPFAA